MDEITLPENQSTKFCCFHQTETHQEFLQLYVRCLVILLAFDPDVFFSCILNQNVHWTVQRPI